MWVVKLHNKFITEANDVDFVVDETKLKTPESDALYAWLEDVLSGADHQGKNKESWVDKHGTEKKEAKSYKNACAWHYHCGPTKSVTGTISTTAALERNFQGQQTSEAAHYIKIESSKTIVVFGFSRIHVPFLNDASNQSAKQLSLIHI